MGKNIQLTYVNVGYGEAMLLEYGDSSKKEEKYVMIIDGGSSEKDEYSDHSSGRLPLHMYMEKKDIDHVDCMVVTHIHEDHLCGLITVAEKFPVRELWQSLPTDYYEKMHPEIQVSEDSPLSRKKYKEALKSYPVLCKLVKKSGGKIRCVGLGDKGTIADAISFSVIGPAKKKQEELLCCLNELYQDFSIKKLDRLDARMNNYSIILMLEVWGVRILLPGDTNYVGYEGIPEKEMKADIFKIGHHGQKDAVTEGILEQIHPRITVCCASSDRRYNSACPETMRLILNAGSDLLFSDSPELPDDMEAIRPHHALKIEITEDGEIFWKYIQV